VTTCIG